MTERDLLVDCLKRLNEIQISYMLTRSMVSNYWGIPRTTHDLDFVVQLPPTSINDLTASFKSDYYIEEQAIRAAYQPPYQFNAIDTRSALKVDFWMLQPTEFEQMIFSRRIHVSLFGEPAWICTTEDVILHKLLWNQISPSTRQLGDAAGVVAVQKEQLDLQYLRAWANTLSVNETLEDLLSGKIQPKQT